MDMCSIGVGLAVLIGFIVGLLLDVDTFAGGIFSILKGSKNKDKDK
ncbi:MAG: hypothetical protein H8E76_03250 [Helicobacteraceae bacterium]|nr:hypothetical protein [Candidatus Sulfurimonas ponti]MBL6973060.1 hypothetical protein [Sulfurimonas sp.]